MRVDDTGARVQTCASAVPNPNPKPTHPSIAASFRIPDGGPYLATHSVGCMTNAALEALSARFTEPWSHRGVGAWDEWLAAIEDFRASLALMFGGRPADYCPQLNLSASLSALLGSLPTPSPARNVWIAAEDSFPSLGFVLQRARSLGHELRLIPRTHSPAQLSTWIDALTPDVCGVLVTQVFSNTGVVAPVRDIARHARGLGIRSIVDVAQSAGVIPVLVEDLKADVVLGSCVKWLCGGPGAGFLWMREEFAGQLTPTDIGWFSHERPFDLDIHSFRYAEGAQRFWGGTPSVAPYVMAAASVRLLAGIGVNAILAHTRELQSAFHAALPEHWQSRVPLAGIGGTLCIPCGDSLDAVQRGLAVCDAHYDRRGDVLRLSFHVVNTVDQARSIAGAFP
jgi:kynureninase